MTPAVVVGSFVKEKHTRRARRVNKVTWSKECIAEAKKKKRPLFAIAIDGRHIPPGEPGHGSGMTMVGSCNPEFAKKVTELFLQACKEK